MSASAAVFVATSLDGFIARPDGSLDWLNAANALIPRGEDCGYGEFVRSIDVVVMGRNTFEQVLTFDVWPYADRRVVVLSSRAIEIPAALAATVSASAEAPGALLERLTAEGAKRLYVDGGITIQRFLAAGLIDDITVTLIPVLLGRGRPLFGPGAQDIQLTLRGSKTFEFGFVQLSYRVTRAADARLAERNDAPPS
jgi:dihydrofolate reductase